MSQSIDGPSRGKQLFVGGAGVLFVALVIGISWRLAFFDGFVGELFALIVGVFSTPVLLESSLIVLGLIVVVAINALRLRREGDEFVYLEEVTEPNQAALPEGARKVIYREMPESKVDLGSLTLAEGAFELGDYKEAWAYLEQLPSEEFASEDALVLRLKLAKSTGKIGSAQGALEALRELNPENPLLKDWEA